MVARLTRLVRGVVVAVALALVVAAPFAAAQPARTVLHFPGDRVGHFQPGDGCTFGVTVYASPPAHVTITDFSDGTEVVQQYAMKRVITSDVTGKTFLDNQVYRDAEWIDPATGLIQGETSGQFIDRLHYDRSSGRGARRLAPSSCATFFWTSMISSA